MVRCVQQLCIFALLLQCTTAVDVRMGRKADIPSGKMGESSLSDPKPTLKGYLPVDDTGSELYYAFWEAQNPRLDVSRAPIILWLQGGPGCASTFGGFYELGPYQVTENLKLEANPGSWAWSHGLLLIDQPLGTGYSLPARNESIPQDELGMAAHLFTALQAFFTSHAHQVEGRPLFITGESYAGKYVPSIAHYILQAQDMHQAAASSSSAPAPALGAAADSSTPAPAPAPAAAAAAATNTAPGEDKAVPRGSGVNALMDKSNGKLKVWRKLPINTPSPVFWLAGVAIGNGLTDPRAQIPVMSEAAHYMGLLPPALRSSIQDKAAHVITLIDNQQWLEAHVKREALREFITNVTGLGTMFDTRREEGYDPQQAIDRFLNLPEVKAHMGARAEIQYKSCSPVVRDIMAADTMQSVKHLLPDVLEKLPVLLYQGQFDILDGVASSIAWIETLDWPLREQMTNDPGSLWVHKGHVAGWSRQAGKLTHSVVYRAGHMVPHDQPEAAQALIEEWVASALASRHSLSKL